MPISVTELIGDLAEVTITLSNGEVKVKYYPSRYTPNLEESFHERIDDQRYSESMVLLLAGRTGRAAVSGTNGKVVQEGIPEVLGLVHSWDITNDDGSPLLATPDTMKQLPSTFLRKVMDSIIQDMRPNAESDENSADS